MPGHLAGGRGPPLLVDDRVVAPAQQRPVEQAGGPSVNPMDQVMRIGPLRRRRTARDRAALVAQPQRPQQPWGERSPGPAHVQDLGALLYTSPSPRDGLLSRMPS